MRKYIYASFLCLFIGCILPIQGKNLFQVLGEKPRIVVLTDIAPASIEPDDMESMIRLMAHADLYEIEALIASGGWNSSGRAYPLEWMDSLSRVIDAYEKDLPKLMKRSGQTSFLSSVKENKKQTIGYWPSAQYLRDRVMSGSLKLGQKEIGANNRSKGSDYIIQLADEKDKRPLWILAWGGANTLAQAIWQVQQERTPDELKAFLNKIRVYSITDQDVPWGERDNHDFSSHQWMRQEFSNDLLFIWDESAWLSQNDIGAKNWKEYAAHIQRHGHLGSIYPKNKWGVEGDTPSFLYVLPNGLNNPSMTNQIGWGGYFEWGMSADKKTHCYTNHTGSTKKSSQFYERYFYPAIFNNFAARMDWADKGNGNRNPIVIVNKQKGLKTIYLKARPKERINLDASRSYDLDGDQLTFRWWLLPEAGSYKGDNLDIENPDDAKATITIPATSKTGDTLHIICEVTDKGTPALTSYRRVVVTIK